MAPEIKKPVQSRAVKTREKILDAGMKLFSERGFRKTNTALIAKEAGVSTGVVYRYFTDKEDILMECITVYLAHYKDYVRQSVDAFEHPEDLRGLIRHIIELVNNYQRIMHQAHHEIIHKPNGEVDMMFYLNRIEKESTDMLMEVFADSPYIEMTIEKGYIIVWLLDRLTEEINYEKHDDADLEKMKEEVVEIIYHMIIKK